jgi:hypothetical protein
VGGIYLLNLRIAIGEGVRVGNIPTFFSRREFHLMPPMALTFCLRRDAGGTGEGRDHRRSRPRYLTKTYTDKGDMVFDICAGSGTTPMRTSLWIVVGADTRTLGPEGGRRGHKCFTQDSQKETRVGAGPNDGVSRGSSPAQLRSFFLRCGVGRGRHRTRGPRRVARVETRGRCSLRAIPGCGFQRRCRLTG